MSEEVRPEDCTHPERDGQEHLDGEGTGRLLLPHLRGADAQNREAQQLHDLRIAELVTSNLTQHTGSPGGARTAARAGVGYSDIADNPTDLT